MIFGIDPSDGRVFISQMGILGVNDNRRTHNLIVQAQNTPVGCQRGRIWINIIVVESISKSSVLQGVI